MATLSFEGETHQEIVIKVKKWLASQSGDERLSASDAVAATADLTKEALRIVAAAAPEPIAQNDIVKALTGMGYKATDASRDAVLQSLNALSSVTGGGLLTLLETMPRKHLVCHKWYRPSARLMSPIRRSVSEPQGW